MIYWQGINISDWRFFRNFANIINYMDTPIKNANSPIITLTDKLSCVVLKFELNCPVNRMYTLISVCSCSCYQYLLWVSTKKPLTVYDNCPFLIDRYDQCIHVLWHIVHQEILKAVPYQFFIQVSYSGRGARGFPLPSLSPPSPPVFWNLPQFDQKPYFKKLIWVMWPLWRIIRS